MRSKPANKLHEIGKFAGSQARELSLDWARSVVDGQIRQGVNVNAVAAAEISMIVEDRIARLESDVAELKGDVKTLNARMNESIIANTREFGSLSTRMENGFGTLRTEIEKNRADMEKGLGTLRADTESGFGSLKTSIESAKLWMLVTGVGSVILVTFVTFLGRALKLL
jgi:hypothetical protein